MQNNDLKWQHLKNSINKEVTCVVLEGDIKHEYNGILRRVNKESIEIGNEKFTSCVIHFYGLKSYIALIYNEDNTLYYNYDGITKPKELSLMQDEDYQNLKEEQYDVLRQIDDMRHNGFFMPYKNDKETIEINQAKDNFIMSLDNNDILKIYSFIKMMGDKYKNTYSLFEDVDNRVVLQKQDNEWKTYYSKKNRAYNILYFNNIDDAIKNILNTVVIGDETRRALYNIYINTYYRMVNNAEIFDFVETMKKEVSEKMKKI